MTLLAASEASPTERVAGEPWLVPGGAAVREEFAGYRDRLIHEWLRTLSALGAVLIPLFFVLDLVTMPPGLLSRFVVYRAAGTLFALVQFAIIRRTRPSRWSYVHGYAFSVMVGAMIVRMTIDLGGFDSSYYAGLNLVIVAVNLILPWRAIHSAVNGLLVVAIYVGANLGAGLPFHSGAMINNLYFLLATVVISVAITFLKHRLIEQEFRLREELLEVNGTLDRSREELKAARDALWGEMEMAKRIQTALLPGNRRLGRYEVAALMQPAAEVGGDYYELFETRQGEHWVAVGDVSGHGVESGLVMMMAQTSLLTAVNDTPGKKPSEVLRAINGVICENVARLDAQRFMTLNVIRLLEDRLVVAGKHQDLLVHRHAQGSVETVSNAGSWIGILRDLTAHASDLEVPLSPGDSVLLFTDGVTEAENLVGDQFGQARLEAAFARAIGLPPAEALRALLDEVQAFQAEQQDDITLMLLRCC